MTPPDAKHILVIKLGALGDFVQATAAFADIRAAHPNAHITLLTTRGMLPMAQNAPWFDDIVLDTRPKPWQLKAMAALIRNLRGHDLVYDLQTNQRSTLYYFLAGRPAWCGIAPGCTYRQTRADRNTLHTLERIADQLAQAGVASTHSPNLNHARADASAILARNGLTPGAYVALVAGGSAHRPEKRWPFFAQLATGLAAEGHRVALVGGPAEQGLLEEIARHTGAVNLGGKTSVPQTLDVLARAQAVVGNDTGPVHMAAALGTPVVVLFGAASNPALCAPRTPQTRVLVQASLTDLAVADVLAATRAALAHKKG